jgi:hypothetical protein
LADVDPSSLRAAIQTADAGSHSDKFTIGFGVSGTIDLQSPLLDLNNNIAIQGPGASSLEVERAAGATFASAIVTVDAGQTASLSGLTIANGNAGGIENEGSLTVSGCVLSGNANFGSFSFGVGGAILNNSGTLTVSGCTLSRSSAIRGGGIENDGGLTTVSGSILSGNSAHDGAGIDSNGGTVTVSDSALSGNTASGRLEAGAKRGLPPLFPWPVPFLPPLLKLRRRDLLQRRRGADGYR